ncbi:hypothetical protein Metme_1459 [Methylomonas methanica MC09]|uniref:Uncharacterized protein n=1 Tax=Methylomonas methanica (strain DSM 25384 / MC09) TaxID=857087 RepID=F9ZZ27_METMM|nr:hypothetical protein Metme_1459 [Methylomonas methanica MC09]
MQYVKRDISERPRVPIAKYVLAEMENGRDKASGEAQCRVAAERFFMEDVGASNAKPYFFCWLHNIDKQIVGYVTRVA